MKKVVFIFVFLFSVNLFSITKTETYKYSLKVVYSTMIRFLAVRDDNIVSKDPEGAFIKFKNKEKDISGTIELIEINKNKTVLKVSFKGANYKLNRFLRKFGEKLKEEEKLRKDD